MPELPEVQTVVTQLAGRLPGATIARVLLGRRDIVHSGHRILTREAVGEKIASVGRVGKRIVIHLGGGAEIVVHLGMSGRLTVEPIDEALAPHTHLRVRFVGRTDELRFRDPRRFGGVWCRGRSDDSNGNGLPHLGPDALAIRVPVLRQVLSRRRQVKAILMDQRMISGLGNIYCDEALHKAAIHPLTPADSLSSKQINRLACSIRSTLKAAIKAGGSSLRDYRNANGEPGWFQVSHRVYGREGEACRNCGAEIIRRLIAGRSTHFCPACQKEPVTR